MRSLVAAFCPLLPQGSGQAGNRDCFPFALPPALADGLGNAIGFGGFNTIVFTSVSLGIANPRLIRSGLTSLAFDQYLWKTLINVFAVCD